MIRALSSSLEHLATALKRAARDNEAQQAFSAALAFKERIAPIYKWKGDLPELAKLTLETSSVVNHELANQMLLKTLEICRKLAADESAYAPRLAKTLELLGAGLANIPAQFKPAVSYWKEAEEIFRGLAIIHPRFIINQSRVAGSLALLLFERKFVPEAINYARRAVDCLENVSSSDVNSLTLKAQAEALLGDAFAYLTEWDTAIAHYREAELNWAGLTSMNDEDLMCRAEVLIGLGTAFLIGKRNPKSSLEPFTNAVELLRKIEKPDLRVSGSLAGTLDRLGSAHADAAHDDEALASYLEAQTILRGLPANECYNVVNLAINLLNVARLKKAKGDEEEAKKDLTEADNICQPFLNSPEPPNEDVRSFPRKSGQGVQRLQNE